MHRILFSMSHLYCQQQKTYLRSHIKAGDLTELEYKEFRTEAHGDILLLDTIALLQYYLLIIALHAEFCWPAKNNIPFFHNAHES